MRCLVLAVLLWSCKTLDVTECASGLVCPAGTRCDDDHRECLSPDQETVCNGEPAGSPCETATISGTCRDELCLPARCGNAFVDPQEDCDDGEPSARCQAGCVLPSNPEWSIEPIAPIGNHPHGAVYDPVSDAVIYVAGGFTWAWDGAWRVLGEAPQLPFEYTVVYDPVRDRIVLINFTWEVYEWDRVAWTKVVDFYGIDLPTSFAFDAAYDATTQQIVIVAADTRGSFQVRSLDPTTWTTTVEPAPPGNAEVFSSVSIAFNDNPHVLVLVIGTIEFGQFAQVFERTNGTWARAPDAPPMLGRDGATVRFVPNVGVLAVGGRLGPAVSRWNPTGETWTALAELPVEATAPVVSHRPARGAFVLADQGTNVAELVGGAWVDTGPLAPPIESACAYDADRSRVIVHGPDVFGEQTWQWDVASRRWRKLDSEILFGGNGTSSIVYAPANGVVLASGPDLYRLTDRWAVLFDSVFLDAVALDAQQRLVGLGHGPQPNPYGVVTLPEGVLITEAPEMSSVFDLVADPRSKDFVLQGDSGLFDHGPDGWTQSPLFGFFPLVTDPERRSLLAVSRTAVWERVAGEWYRREDIPNATASQVGACFDPINGELFVLGLSNDNPVLLRRTDRLPAP